jgi:GTP-binding protein Era
MPFRSGFVAVVGRPNVGKSTLLNALLGQKVAIVSSKPQTTRRRQLGILSLDDAQIIFVDTPGIHRPRHALDQSMLAAATQALADADAILWMVDISEPPAQADRQIAGLIAQHAPETPLVLAMNKSDRLPPQHVLPHSDAFRALAPAADWMLISAVRGDNVEKIVPMLLAVLPEGPAYYDPQQVTDFNLRDMAAELVREAALDALREEVPHGVAVEIDDYADPEAEGRVTRISATVYVERENHKGILIGKGGDMLKRIGMQARKQIEAQIDGQVFLELHVRVRENWRQKDGDVKRLGYGTQEEE